MDGKSSGNKDSLSSPSAASATADAALGRLRRIGMAPRDRPEHRQLPRASVLVPLFRREDDDDEHKNNHCSSLHVLLTQRPLHLRTHAGEVCFPGGKQDIEDQGDDVRTALREAEEEVGLPPRHVQPLCRLATLESYTGLCVTPVVGLVVREKAAEPASLTLSPSEVAAAFAVPLVYFLEESNLTSKQEVQWRGGTFEMRTYHYNDEECGRTFKIWGLTAYIAHMVAQISVAGFATVERPIKEERAIEGEDESTEQHRDPNLLMSGYLFRKEDSRKSFWSQRFFVLEGNTLHQYDNEQQAARKANSATKKNRLPLFESNVDETCTAVVDGRYSFVISALSGRVKWELAAATDEDRQRWIQSLRNSKKR